ncbi:MAG: hypothetical protein WCO06_04070 [Candidatus Roizmanbacteria bacterium]
MSTNTLLPSSTDDILPPPPSKEPLLYVTIRSIDSVAFKNYVKSISSKNERGEFDILPMHANFISLVQEKIIVTLIDDSTQEYIIDAAIIKIFNNRVDIYMGVGMNESNQNSQMK